MLHLRPLPKQASRCDVRMRAAKFRETTERLKREVGVVVTAPAPCERDEPSQPWHTYNND